MKGNSQMGNKVTKSDVKKQQSYLVDHSWFYEPYEAAMHLSEEMPDLILKPNFARAYPVSARDFLEECPPNKNCYMPHTYFDFMSLIGGFDCGSVYLNTENFETYGVQQFTSTSVNDDDQAQPNRDINENGSLKILLGGCDHGLYVFDTETDSYFLEGYSIKTPFVNCVAMLLHAIYRARTNMGLEHKALQNEYYS